MLALSMALLTSRIEPVTLSGCFPDGCLIFDGDDFVWCAIAAIVRFARDFVSVQLAPMPLAAYGRNPAATIKSVVLRYT